MPKGDYQRLKADIEDGIVPIAHLLLQALSMAKLNGVAKGIVLFIWRRTYGWAREGSIKYKEDRITLAEFAQAVNSERTYVSKQLKLLVKARVIYEQQDPVNGRYKDYGMNTVIGDWSSEVIDKDALAKAVQEKLYLHSSKVVQTDNRCANTQPCANEQPLRDQTTQPLRDHTTLSIEISRNGAENGATKNSIKNSIADTTSIPPISPTPEQEREIETFLQVRMDNPGYRLVTDDFKAFKEMVGDGISLDVIKQAVTEVTERFQPRHKHDRITKFTYFRGPVYDLWETTVTREQVAATGPSQPRNRGRPAARDEPRQNRESALQDSRYDNFYKLFPNG